MVKKFRCLSCFLISLFFISFFSFPVVFAQESTDVEGTDATRVTFSSDVAGITPDSFWYFFDFFHTPEEVMHEAGLMALEGNVEATRIALENFAEEIESQRNSVEEISVEGINVESFQSDPGLHELYETQVDLLNYQLYVDSINSVLIEKVDDTESAVAKELVELAENSISYVGVAVEERTATAIEVAAENSGVPTIEADFAFEGAINEVANERYPEISGRFQEIADINDIQELKIKINELRTQISELEETESDDTELTAAKELLQMAESHGVYCLHAEESDLGITADIHFDAAENFLNNAEKLLEGEVEITDIEEELEHSRTLTQEEIQDEIQSERDDATVFAEQYERLQEEYADDPVKLAVLNAEDERLQKVEQLGKQLYENGVMEKYTRDNLLQLITHLLIRNPQFIFFGMKHVKKIWKAL